MNSTSETRAIFLMMLFIFFFIVNTLAVQAFALALPACGGWKITLFRGFAGTLIVLFFYQRLSHLRTKSLVDRPKVFARGLLGGVGVSFFYRARSRPSRPHSESPSEQAWVDQLHEPDCLSYRVCNPYDTPIHDGLHPSCSYPYVIRRIHRHRRETQYDLRLSPPASEHGSFLARSLA
ncbi:MAG: hypothetical protein ABF381_09085 [Akkermansiaceae bacterium]